jgi:hypothetical protein
MIAAAAVALVALAGCGHPVSAAQANARACRDWQAAVTAYQRAAADSSLTVDDIDAEYDATVAMSEAIKESQDPVFQVDAGQLSGDLQADYPGVSHDIALVVSDCQLDGATVSVP